MRDHALAAPVIARLAGHVKRQFADPIAACRAAPSSCLRIATQQVAPDQVCIATEGALWGSVKAHGFLPETVIISDDAGQFDVGRHALCWVHAERLVHKLDTFTDLRSNRTQSLRPRIDLVVLRRSQGVSRRSDSPGSCGVARPLRPHLQAADRLCHPRSAARMRLHANKPELLMVLDRPKIPLQHQRLREHHPLPGHQTEGQRRHPQRCWTRLSRMPSSVSPKPAPCSASVSGIISATGSPSQATQDIPPLPPLVSVSLPIAVIARTFATVTVTTVTSAEGRSGYSATGKLPFVLNGLYVP